MNQSRHHADVHRLPMLVPNLTAFLAGLCIMTVELLAGNVIAGYIGSSLYTWTSVIGVILAGIALGNYVGGKLADRWMPERILAWLFLASAATCAAVPSLNHLAGEALDALDVTPQRIAIHILIVFIAPSLCLGGLSPVVAKMALDRGLATGWTVGSVYAANAGGSIAGTFLTGFVLVPNMRTSRTVLAVSVVLAVMALAYAVSGRRGAARS